MVTISWSVERGKLEVVYDSGLKSHYAHVFIVVQPAKCNMQNFKPLQILLQILLQCIRFLHSPPARIDNIVVAPFVKSHFAAFTREALCNTQYVWFLSHKALREITKSSPVFQCPI